MSVNSSMMSLVPSASSNVDEVKVATVPLRVSSSESISMLFA